MNFQLLVTYLLKKSFERHKKLIDLTTGTPGPVSAIRQQWDTCQVSKAVTIVQFG